MITLDDVSVVDILRYSVFASDLGLKPGPFPLTLPTLMGNCMAFMLIKQTADKAVYRQSAGCIELTVFND